MYSKLVNETLAGEDFHSAIAYLGADIHNRGREGSGLDLIATEMVIGQNSGNQSVVFARFGATITADTDRLLKKEG